MGVLSKMIDHVGILKAVAVIIDGTSPLMPLLALADYANANGQYAQV
jgi:hypothetical protein